MGRAAVESAVETKDTHLQLAKQMHMRDHEKICRMRENCAFSLNLESSMLLFEHAVIMNLKFF